MSPRVRVVPGWEVEGVDQEFRVPPGVSSGYEGAFPTLVLPPCQCMTPLRYMLAPNSRTSPPVARWQRRNETRGPSTRERVE